MVAGSYIYGRSFTMTFYVPCWYFQMTEAQERKRSRRRVVKTNHFDFDGLDNEEQRMVQQAIRNSQRDQKRAARDSCIIPLAPVFHPSPEEFTNPIQYISK